MSDSGRDARSRRVAVPDAAVSRYETLPLDEVREELRIAGIDPVPTIAAVRKLVEDSLARSKPPRATPTKSRSRSHNAPAQRPRSFVLAAHHDAANDDNF
jgi:hypothetical protein